MNTIIEYLPAWNSWLALLLYWLPLVLCTYGYFVRTIADYRKDLRQRAIAENPETKPAGYIGTPYYEPKLTIGLIVGRIVASIVPAVNLCAAVVSIGPEVFGDFFDWLGRVFDMPLVPKRKKDPQA